MICWGEEVTVHLLSRYSSFASGEKHLLPDGGVFAFFMVAVLLVKQKDADLPMHGNAKRETKGFIESQCTRTPPSIVRDGISAGDGRSLDSCVFRSICPLQTDQSVGCVSRP